jgi:hypothetical protein
MTPPAPLEQLSSLALVIWRHVLTDHGQTVPEVADRLEAIGHIEAPQDVSAACKELVRAGWAMRRMRGFRHLRTEQLALTEVA